MAKVKGRWVFNTVLTDAGTEGSVISGQTVSFTSNGGVFDRIIPIAGYQSVMTYSNIEYSYSVYSHSAGWTNEAFKVIDFDATEQEVSADFYAWFVANATPEGSESGGEPDEPAEGDVLLAIWKSTLIGIAEEVRSKTGKTAQMLGSEIKVEIRSIKGGGSNLQKFDGTVEVTGQPISGGGTSAPKLQEKTATENGVVFPDTGYDGLSKVTVNVLSADNPLPAEVATESEMNALLNTAEVGSIYKYVGESGTYENGALYVVEGDGLISFTIDGVSYQAEEGMTWGEWVESEYNTDGYYISANDFYVHKDYFNHVPRVLPTYTITSGTAYTLIASGGSND